MVEINNQRKAFLDMLAWSEGPITDVRKTRNHGYDTVAESYLLINDHPRETCHAKTQNQINRRRTLPAFSCWCGCSLQGLA